MHRCATPLKFGTGGAVQDHAITRSMPPLDLLNGVQILGGCCGLGVGHIRALVDTLTAPSAGWAE
jgi:methionine synthase I (cobalamin-dependent)